MKEKEKKSKKAISIKPKNSEDFENLPTKVLLSYLNYARYMSQLNGLKVRDLQMREDDPSIFYYESLFETLKKELAKRPHIPNKKESKKLRQEAAKRGK
jgi:hypothetical protein